MRGEVAPVVIKAPSFTIEGISRAGNETWFRLRELGLAFDIGRCPDLLIGTPHVFVTHAHLDHALGIPFYFSQRNLQGLSTGTVYVPAASEKGFEALMSAHRELEAMRHGYVITGLAPGDVVELRRGLHVRAHAATHRIPSNAWEVIEVRRKLRPEFSGLEGRAIAELRETTEVTERREESVVFYTGDTDRGILEVNRELFLSRVLMIECSFTAPEDRVRAREYTHMHLEDLYDFSDRFENEMIVLTHFSLRDSPADIHRRISSSCPERLRERLRLALPEPFVRIGGRPV